MADLVAADVAVSIPVQDRNFVRSPSKQFALAEITFGDGIDTYPAGGVPLPDISQFGFKKQIDFVSIEQPPANGFFYKYDRANHKIMIFHQGVTTGSTGAADSTSGALAEDYAGDEGTVRMMDTAINTTYDMGGLTEMLAAATPVEATLKLLMIGQ